MEVNFVKNKKIFKTKLFVTNNESYILFLENKSGHIEEDLINKFETIEYSSDASLLDEKSGKKFRGEIIVYKTNDISEIMDYSEIIDVAIKTSLSNALNTLGDITEILDKRNFIGDVGELIASKKLKEKYIKVEDCSKEKIIDFICDNYLVEVKSTMSTEQLFTMKPKQNRRKPDKFALVFINNQGDKFILDELKKYKGLFLSETYNSFLKKWVNKSIVNNFKLNIKKSNVKIVDSNKILEFEEGIEEIIQNYNFVREFKYSIKK